LSVFSEPGSWIAGVESQLRSYRLLLSLFSFSFSEPSVSFTEISTTNPETTLLLLQSSCSKAATRSAGPHCSICILRKFCTIQSVQVVWESSNYSSMDPCKCKWYLMASVRLTTKAYSRLLHAARPYQAWLEVVHHQRQLGCAISPPYLSDLDRDQGQDSGGNRRGHIWKDAKHGRHHRCECRHQRHRRVYYRPTALSADFLFPSRVSRSYRLSRSYQFSRGDYIA
jgi:hypothetical protein